jgi:hypothetical protein
MEHNTHGKVILCHGYTEIAHDAEHFLAEHRDSMCPQQVTHLEAAHRSHGALAQASATAH